MVRNSSASSSAVGIAFVSVAAVLWGTTGTAQSLGAGGLSPFWVGAAQLAVSSLFLGALLAVSHRRLRGRAGQGGAPVQPLLPNPVHLGLRPAWFLLASMGIGGYSIFFYEGVTLTGVAVGTAVAIGSGPIWAGLMQALVLRAPLSALWWAGTLVSVAGGAAMVMARGGATLSWSGLALCLLAGLSYAGYALINKRLVTHMSPRVVNFYVFTGAACMAVPIALVQSGLPQWSLAAVLVVVYLGVVVSGLAHMLFSIGLRSISGPTGVTLSLIEPVAAFVLAVWVVGERQPLQSWLGLLAVLAGLMLVIGAEMRSQRAVMAAQMA
ncbi:MULTISPECIES: EamA family transporter [Delftia]|uniref:DMT family transporter n=1 Tax=Delftia TaxID=80865 RepID=UPI0009298621|nr:MULTISPECIES: EamA family transporter [Delftia]MCX7508379.1 EamA family transporter [Delftia tsuruhatensis]MDH0419082.1 EamA family transporter [Delftia tsuruhatensis]OJX17193.1 MAG: DME family drug/metabolite transporter [Delftia sp. 67-8]QFS63181.1 EamA family transporter [Delftia tsuruhatensis]WON90496.1 EamA family transporter [Delftia sp. UGAL515B_04]